MILFRTIPNEQRRWKYRVVKSFAIFVGIHGSAFREEFMELSRDGVLTLLPGYAWDGMSGGARDTQDAMERSAVHDALYQAGRLGLLPPGWRWKADSVFLEMGMLEASNHRGWKRRWKECRTIYTWAVVRVLGGWWNGRHKEPPCVSS